MASEPNSIEVERLADLGVRIRDLKIDLRRTALTAVTEPNIGASATSVKGGVKAIVELLEIPIYQSSYHLLEIACTALATKNPLAPELFHAIAMEPKISEIPSKVLVDDVRAIAATVAAIGYRRQRKAKESREVANLIRTFSPSWAFAGASADHLEAIASIGQSDSEVVRAIQLSRSANEKIGDNAGVKHGLAHLLLEHAIWGKLGKPERIAILREAEGFAKDAEVHERRFGGTLARIRIRLAETPEDVIAQVEAMREVQREVGNKAADTIDAQSRAIESMFEQSLASIRVAGLESAKELETQHADLREELERSVLIESREAQRQNISIVGFMGALLAILNVSVSVMGNGAMTLEENIVLTLVAIVGFALAIFGAVALGIALLNRNFNKAMQRIGSSRHN